MRYESRFGRAVCWIAGWVPPGNTDRVLVDVIRRTARGPARHELERVYTDLALDKLAYLGFRVACFAGAAVFVILAGFLVIVFGSMLDLDIRWFMGMRP